MGCNRPFNTIDDAFALATWLYMALFFYIFGMFMAWRPKWYNVIRQYTYWIVPERLYIVLTLVLTMLNAYAAWRLWVCENWDSYFAPLLMAVLMMIFMNFFPFLLMTTKYASAYMLSALAYLAFAIVFTIFAFIKDSAAGIIGVFDILLALVYFGFSLYAWTKEDHLHSKFGEQITKRPVNLPNVSFGTVTTGGREPFLDSIADTTSDDDFGGEDDD